MLTKGDLLTPMTYFLANDVNALHKQLDDIWKENQELRSDMKICRVSLKTKKILLRLRQNEIHKWIRIYGDCCELRRREVSEKNIMRSRIRLLEKKITHMALKMRLNGMSDTMIEAIPHDSDLSETETEVSDTDDE